MEKDDFHVDMSGRIYEGKTIGIAIVGTKTKLNYGCALKGNLIRLVKKQLFMENIYKDSARLYGICVYLLVKEVKDKINTLIICNDEDFNVVKAILIKLLINYDFEIINIKKFLCVGILGCSEMQLFSISDISEFRKRLGRNVGSFADNYAKIYRKKALKPKRWPKGKNINVVEITYKIIKQYWEESKKIKVSE